MKWCTRVVMGLLFLAAGTRLVADIHYVSPSGDNISPYTSWATAARLVSNAVSVAGAGDTVLVSNGLYFVSSEILLKQDVTLQSVQGPAATILDGSNKCRVVRMAASNAVLDGFTIQHGFVNNGGGGGVCLEGTGVVQNCVIRENKASSGYYAVGGGGVYCNRGGTVRYCEIRDNEGASSGGGVHCYLGGLVQNCAIIGNATTLYGSDGGGIYFAQGGRAENCTIGGNTAYGSGDGIYCYVQGTLENCIIYHNGDENWTPGWSNRMTYCCTTPAVGGAGNFTNDPRCLAPVDGNFRLCMDSPCRDAGLQRPEYLTALDLDGRPRVAGAGVDLGAYEAGPLQADFSATRRVGLVPLDVVYMAAVSATNVDGLWYAWDLDGDSTVDMVGYGLACVTTTYETIGWHSAALTVANAAGETSRSVKPAYYVQAGPTDVYVATNGGAAWPYADWSMAARSLQAAVDAGVTGTRVWVSNGLYVLNQPLTLAHGIYVSSMNGLESTTLTGTGGVRCLYLNHPQAAVDGFTITNGYSAMGSGAYFAEGGGSVRRCRLAGNRSYGYDGGGAVYFAAAGLVEDCEIVGNRAEYRGGGVAFVNGGMVDRCVIYGNRSSQGGGIYLSQGGLLRNSLVYGNAASYGGGASSYSGGLIENSTLCRNSASVVGGGIQGNWGGMLRNSIVYYNAAPEDANWSTEDSGLSFTNCCTFPTADGDGNQAGPPGFLDEEEFNFALMPDSPCRNAGRYETWMEGATDVRGQARATESAVDMGAMETGPLQVDIRGMNLTGPAPLAACFQTVCSGTNTTIVRYDWDLDGDGVMDWSGADGSVTTNIFTTAGHYGVICQAVNSAGETARVAKASGYVKVGPAAAYVAASGAHEYPYDTWAKAATNIQAAIGVGTYGTVVWVANGTYVSGARLAVTNHVTLKSVNGAGCTIVQGEGMDSCVYMDQAEATVEGFTIQGGSGNGGGVHIQSGGRVRYCRVTGNEAYYGAGIYCVASAVVERCEVDGNKAAQDGGGIYTEWGHNQILDCVIRNNEAGSCGGGVYADEGTLLRNCVLARNRGGYGGGGYVKDDVQVDSCTVTDNQGSYKGGGLYWDSKVEIQNSILYFNRCDSSNGGSNYFCNSCQWDGLEYIHIANTCLAPALAGDGNTDADPLFLDVENEAYSLQPGSPCVNAGVHEAWMVGGYDIEGYDRVIQGAVDMGAYEFGPLRCSFRADLREGTAPMAVVFTSFVAGTNLAGLYYKWDFNGDGVADQEGYGLQEVTNRYNDFGTFAPRLVVAGADAETQSCELPGAGIRVAPAALYVDPSGAAIYPYTNWSMAARDIQTAVDQSARGSCVWVSNGVYTLSASVTIPRAMTVRSLNGAEAATIHGNDAVQCVSLLATGATISGFTLTGGRGHLGGGVYCGRGAVVDRCRAMSNRAYHASSTLVWGGGVYCEGGTVRYSAIEDNRTAEEGYGGGGYITSSGLVEHCTILRNEGGYGGGLYVTEGSVVRNSIVAGNLALNSDYNESGGGGVYCSTESAIENCTIVNNRANRSGAGVLLYYNGYVHNSIIWSNQGANVYIFGGMGYVDHTCSTPLPAGNGNIAADPLFADLETLDVRLQPGSPCINVGTNQAWMAKDTDYQGYDRIINGRVDLGVYEFSPANTVRVSGHTPAGNALPPLGSLLIHFQYEMDPASFSIAEDILRFEGPSGAISATQAAWLSSRTLQLTFPTQTELGSYELVLGSQMSDREGRGLDQDGDGVPGESPDDEYLAAFRFPAFWVMSHEPNGERTEAVDSLRIRFSQPVQPGDCTAADVTLNGPLGSIPIANDPLRVSNDLYEVAFPRQVAGGTYALTVGPEIWSADGELLDQDGDGMPGEPEHDRYEGCFTIVDNAGPRIVSVLPAYARAAVSNLVIRFSEPMSPEHFTTEDLTLSGPDDYIVLEQITAIAPDEFQVSFPAATDAGTYSFSIGPDVRDVAGNMMDQDQDGQKGEDYDDVYYGEWVLDRTCPRVTWANPSAGELFDALTRVDVQFSEEMDFLQMTPNLATCIGPYGVVQATNIVAVSTDSARFYFPATEASGELVFRLAESACDLAGNPLDQNQNGVGGEPGDAFSRTYEQSLPDLVIGGLSGPTEAWPEQAVDVTWMATNAGPGWAAGPWHDVVRISPTAQPGPNDLVLASLEFDGELEPDGSYTRVWSGRLPALAEGRWWLHATLDASNRLAEGGGSFNNRLTTTHPLWITSRPGPDLRVDELEAAEAMIGGWKYRVTWRVANHGTAGTSAAGWQDRVYLSPQPVFDSSQAVAVSPPIRNPDFLASGESYEQEAEIVIPFDTGYGDWYLMVRADDQNQVEEFGAETNNAKGLAVSITGPNVSDEPYLSVVSIEAPAVLRAGQRPDITWTIRNTGGQTILNGWASGTGWDDGLAISPDPIYDASDYWLGSHNYWNGCPLAPGESYTTTGKPEHPIPAWAGSYYLIVVPDTHFGANAAFGASMVDRSFGVFPVTIEAGGGYLDLVVTNIITPPFLSPGQTTRIGWQVRNIAVGSLAGKSWCDRIFLSDDGSLNGALLLAEKQGPSSSIEGYDASAGIQVPADMEPGAYYLVAAADVRNELTETDENNNVGISTQTVHVVRREVDLTISTAAAPSAATSGGLLNVQWTTLNRGRDELADDVWQDAWYLSTHPEFHPVQARCLGRFKHEQTLAAGGEMTNAASVAVPFDVEGAYYVHVVCDSAGAVFEYQGETNNVYRLPGLLTVNGDAADLTVLNIQCPTQAAAGQSMSILWGITNAGNLAAEAPWMDAVYLSTNEVWSRQNARLVWCGTQTNRLAAGGMKEQAGVLVSLADGISGLYYVYVETDSRQEVYERGAEPNNIVRSLQPVTVVDYLPDLEIVSSFVTGEPAAGELVSVSWTIANRGEDYVTAPWDEAIYLSTDAVWSVEEDLLLARYTHGDEVAAGATSACPVEATSVRLPARIGGVRYLLIVTDPDGARAELCETNNVAVVSTLQLVEKSPNLTVAAVTAPPEALAGSVIPFQWTVDNRGDRAVESVGWRDAVYLSRDDVFEPQTDIEVGSVERTGPLGTGAAYSSSCSLPLRQDLEGSYQVFVATDSRGEIYEAGHEADNVSTSFVTLVVQGSRVDLCPAAFAGPAEAYAGQEAAIVWEVRNQGRDATPAVRWEDALYLSEDNRWDAQDQRLASVGYNGPLAARSQYRREHSAMLPENAAGDFFLILKTDAGSFNDVFEYQAETNNTRVQPIHIALPPPADLQPVGIANVGALWSGQSAQIEWTVRNSGLAAAAGRAGSWYDGVYLSRDPFLDRDQDIRLGSSERVGALAPEGSYAASGTFRLPRGISGPYYLLVAVDETGEVPERGGEGNNLGVSAAPISILMLPPSDLEVLTLAWSTNAIGYDDSLTLTGLAANTWSGGDSALGVWWDTLYLSSDRTWDLDDPRIARLRHEGEVAAGETYSLELATNLPSVLLGDYFVIARADILNDVRERSETNNLYVSTGVVTVVGRELVLNQPRTNRIAAGPAQMHHLAAYSNDERWVTLTPAGEGRFELYAAYGRLPGRSDYDEQATSENGEVVNLRIPATASGAYYVAVYGSATGAPAMYYLEAREAGYAIANLNLSMAGAGGQATLTVKGSGFKAGMTARLENASGVIVAEGRLQFLNAGEAAVTFDLTTAAPGTYVLIFENPDGTTVQQNFTVVPPSSEGLYVNLNPPAFVRANRSYALRLVYGNRGNRDIPAPIVKITAGGGGLISLRSGDPLEFKSSVLLLAAAPQGMAGILPPHSEYTMELPLLVNGDEYVPFNMNVIASTNVEVLDWQKYENTLRPSEMSDQEWQPMFDRFKARMGATWGSYDTRLALDATRLAPRGIDVADVDELLGYEKSLALGMGPAAVVGTVIDAASGLVLTGMVVQALQDGEYRGDAISASNGLFVISALEAGSYVLQVKDALPAEEVRVDVSAAQDALGVVVRASRGYTLTGSVSDERGWPVTNALVLLSEQSRGSVAAAPAWQPDGTFAMKALAQGCYRVQAAAGGYLPAVQESIPLDDQHPASNLVFRLERGASLTGVVRDGSTLAPVSGALVCALTRSGGRQFGRTDAAGAYTLRGLSADGWEILAMAEGYLKSEAIAVEFEAHETKNQDLTLMPGAVLVGRLVGLSGAPVTGVTVKATTETSSGSAATDDQGWYRIVGLGAGIHQLTAGGTGGLAPARAETPCLVPGAETRLPDVRLVEGGVISGRIVAAQDSLPIAGASLAIAGRDDGPQSVIVGADGRFSAEGYPAGSYLLSASAPDHADVQRLVTMPSNLVCAATELALSSPGVVTGTVCHAAGLPLSSGVVVRLYSPQGLRLGEVPVDVRGGFRYAPVVPGAYVALPASDQWAFTGRTIQVAAGSVCGVRFVAESSGLTGTVVDAATGDPIAGAQLVYRSEREPAQLWDAQTSANGEYEFSSLAPGPGHLTVSAPGKGRVRQAVTLPAQGRAHYAAALSAGYTIDGRVTDAATGKPIPEALIQVVEQNAGLWGWRVYAGVDTNGSYEVADLPSGEMLLRVCATGYPLVERVVTLSSDIREDVGLATNGYRLRLVVQETPAHAPVSGVMGQLCRDGSPVASFKTDVSGTATIEPLAAAVYDIRWIYPVADLDSGLSVTGNCEVAYNLDPVTAALSQADAMHYRHVLDELPEPEHWWQYLQNDYILAMSEETAVSLACRFIGTVTFWMPVSCKHMRQFLNQYRETIYHTRDFAAMHVQADGRFINFGKEVSKELLTKFPHNAGPGAMILGQPLNTPIDYVVPYTQYRQTHVPIFYQNSFDSPVYTGFGGIYYDDLRLAYGNVDEVFYSGLLRYKKTVDLNLGHEVMNVTYDSLLEFTLWDEWNFEKGFGFPENVFARLQSEYGYQSDYTLTRTPLQVKGTLVFPMYLVRVFTSPDEGGTASAEMIPDTGEKVGEYYTLYSQITLTAQPKPGYRFKEWASLYQYKPKGNPAVIGLFKPALMMAIFEKINETNKPDPDPDNGPPAGGSTPMQSHDPNDKLVDVGVGDERFITEGQSLRYTIRFENQSNATASAQLVTITDPLDERLDWSTLELDAIQFGDRVVEVPSGLQAYDRRVDLRPFGNDLLVDVKARFDRETGRLSWLLEAIDPATGEFTEDPFAGFLPPNDALHSGEGSVSFRIKPRAGLASGTAIPNIASIVFDWNEPIRTPLVNVTIDSGLPSSQVEALPTESPLRFMVSWTGQDDVGGSGLAGYDVYVSTDGDPYAKWLIRTEQARAWFEGIEGSEYRFVALAYDRVGHVEPWPSSAPDAWTRALAIAGSPGDEDGDGIPDDWERAVFGSPLAAQAVSDHDRDGVTDREEYLAGTDALSADSSFVLHSPQLEHAFSPSFVLRWASATNRTYTIVKFTNGFSQGVIMTQGMAGLPPINVYTDGQVNGSAIYGIMTGPP